MPLDSEPYVSPFREQQNAAAALERYRNTRTQIDSVNRVRQSMALLAKVIEGCDWPLGSPFLGQDVSDVAADLRGDARPLYPEDLAAAERRVNTGLRVVS